MPISVTIITYNEEQNIAAALASVAWAAEIIVVDSQSTDNTVAIARQFTNKVIIRPWPGYAAQKQFAAEQASHAWLLSIDADERVTPSLAQEIQAIIETSKRDYQSYYISRQNYYLGYPIYHSGWSPDYQLRLYHKDAGSWQGDFVHESVKVSGKSGKLQGKLSHYTIQNLAAHHERLNRYTTLAAQDLSRRNKPIRRLDILLRPLIAWFRSYIWRLGILDGQAGLVIAYFAAYYMFLKYAKAWEMAQADHK